MTETGRVVRVLPDVSGLDKVFDYRVPPKWNSFVAPGSLVRMDLHGRRVSGWIVDVDVEPPVGVQLLDITKVSSLGPDQPLLELAQWAAHRWSGRMSRLLKVASPETMVETLPAGPGPRDLPDPGSEARDAFTHPGVTVVRLPPGADPFPYLLASASLGDGLVVMPGVGDARFLGGRLRRAGGRVALAGRDWGLGAAGGTVIGARKAAWSRVRSLASVLVFDEHDERLQEERNPTWNARDVALERARRAGVPAVLVSAAPSVAALEAADRLVVPSRSAERAGWPIVEVVDRRDGDPARSGLFSDEFTRVLRTTTGRVICVLNRKGRSPMLACGSCGELVRTDDGERLMTEIEGALVGPGGERRPLVCAVCGGTKLKRLRLGVSRAREELEALAGEPVGEVTADMKLDDLGDLRVLIGTEAVLHRVHEAQAVVFLDVDQELLAPRYRAAEQAMGLLTRAARIVGPRSGGGRLLLQTRTPEHRVLRAAALADPGVFAAEEAEIRRAIQFPPFGALAEVSGAGADDFVDPLLSRLDATVMGPRDDGRYLVRADSAEKLADVLAELPRPKARMRIAVDPPRA